MKKKAEWRAHETWVCYGDDDSPLGVGSNMPDACKNAGAFVGGFMWADRVAAGWRCVRVYDQRIIAEAVK